MKAISGAETGWGPGSGAAKSARGAAAEVRSGIAFRGAKAGTNDEMRSGAETEAGKGAGGGADASAGLETAIQSKSVSRSRNSNPDIAVVIPLYNKEETIGRALSSVIGQTLLPGEVIVVDDGSTDDGLKIVREYAEKFPFLRWFSQENGGVSSARNAGAAATSARCICFLDADDEWEPGYLQEMTRLILQQREADFYSLRYRLRRNGQFEYPSVFCGEDFSGIVPDFLTAYRKGYGLIHSSAVSFRRDFFEKLGGFPESVHNGEDIWLWLRAGILGTFAFSAHIGSTVHKEDLTSEIRRRDHVPYHLDAYIREMEQFAPEVQRPLKRFLMKNLALHWAAAKTEQNRWLSDKLLACAWQLNGFYGLGIKMADLLPADLFYYLARKRVSYRQKESGT